MGQDPARASQVPLPFGIFNLTKSTFEAFGLAEPLNRALRESAYETPTPIQLAALPPQLAGRDMMALAETGSGKTAAFVLPILNALSQSRENPEPRRAATLILAPTRELALQIDAEFAKLARHLHIRRAVVLGGVGKGAQIAALKRGVHVLVATPGRLLDLVSERHADLSHVKTLVLDEADRMFDMGFIRDIRKIVAMLPKVRRTALFSATMPAEIRSLAHELLVSPERVDLSPKQLVVDRIDQKVMIVPGTQKQSRLHTILKDEACARVIVFTRTKRGADRVADRLGMAGIGAAAIHGNKAQNARQRALKDFSAGHVRVLVATDIAARGIDVSGITHVINFDMPVEAETYVHRIGRTARNGAAGIAISLCDPSERGEIAAIEKMMKQKIAVIGDIGGEQLPLPENRPHRTHAPQHRDGQHRDGQHRKGPREGAPARHRDSRNGRPGERQDAAQGEQRHVQRSGAKNPQRKAANGETPRRDRNWNGASAPKFLMRETGRDHRRPSR